MISELDQLEILELLETRNINKDEALKLSQFPKLQTVNLSDSLQRVTGHNTEAPTKPWVPICECMPSEAAQQLQDLREVAPHINWVVKGMGCCDEKPVSPPNTYDWC